MSDTPVDELRAFVTQLRQYRDSLPQWQIPVEPSWEERFQEVERRLDIEPEVSIALLGGTGAGKSSLINALIESRLLPVSSTNACTSAVTEVSYRPGVFSGEVEFIDRAAWHEELALLAADLADARNGAPDGRTDLTVSKAAEDKLVALYGADAAARYLADLDPSLLVESNAVRYAFDHGSHQFGTDDAKQFREELKLFLDSGQPYWPIVKRVRVRGPFPSLSEGVVLVDLPGLNDPNAAREAATREHLTSSQFVWVVFNMKRALTRDVFEFLSEGDLLRRLYTDGRTDSLVFVGTASDDVDVDADIERLRLADDAPFTEIVAGRANEVVGVVRGQLDELGRRVAKAAGEDEVRAAELRRQLRSAPIHCVSAREYQKCIGIMRKSNHLITEASATGLPELQAEANRLLGDRGRSAHRQQLVDMLQLVRQEIVRAVETSQSRAAAQRDATEAQRQEVTAAAAQASRFLEERTTRSIDRFVASLAQAEETLKEKLGAAVQAAEQNVAGIDRLWAQTHWGTMRATVRRNGQWATRGIRIDLAEQLAKPLLDTVAFAWVDFFGDRALHAVDALAGSLNDAAADYIDRFELSLRAIPALTQVFERHGAATAGAAHQLVQQRLNELKRDVNERLTTDRRRLNDDVLDQVRLLMEPAFAEAAAVTGSGTARRMVEILHHHAVRVAEEMFSSVRSEIDELLVELTWFLRGRAESVALGVVREARSMDQLVATRAQDELDANTHEASAEQLRQLGEKAPELPPT